MTRAVLFILRWVAPKILNLLLTVTIVLGGIYYTQYKVEHMVNNVQTKIENKIDNTIRNIKNTVIKVVDSEKIKEARRSVSVAEKEINKAIILIKEINDIINTEYKDASIEEKIGRALGLLDIASEYSPIIKYVVDHETELLITTVVAGFVYIKISDITSIAATVLS